MPSVRSDIVVNTGPVLALAAAGYLHVLRDLFNGVTIPYEVVQEIEAGGQTQFARDEFRVASWMDKRSLRLALKSLTPRHRRKAHKMQHFVHTPLNSVGQQ